MATFLAHITVKPGCEAEVGTRVDAPRTKSRPASFDFRLGHVFGLRRAAEGESIMPELTRRYSRALGQHQGDRTIPGEP